MSSLNVTTYQMSKQNCRHNSGSDGSGITQEIVDRIENLENNQLKVQNEFDYDFYNGKYTDEFKTTTILTNEGMIARQYLSVIRENFDNDDIIDWDYTNGIAVRDGVVKFDSSSTKYGEMFTLPFEVDEAKGFRLDGRYSNKTVAGNVGLERIHEDDIWFLADVDRYGRVWIFSTKVNISQNLSVVKLVIYNKDFTVYKDYEFEASSIFYSGNNMRPVHGNAGMTFTDQNICVISVTSVDSSSSCNGYHGSSTNDVFYSSVVMIDEDGNTRILNQYRLSYNNGSSVSHHRAGYKDSLIYRKNRLICHSGLSGCYMHYTHYSSYSRRYTGWECPNGIDGVDSNIRLSYGIDKAMGVNIHAIHNWVCQLEGNTFYKKETEYFYRPMTPFAGINLSLKLTDIHFAEYDCDFANNRMTSKISNNDLHYYKLTPANGESDYIFGYATPGLNGMYFHEGSNRLYTFGNSTDNNLIMTRVDINFETRRNGLIDYDNVLRKNHTIPHYTYDADRYQNSYGCQLKIYDDGYKLHLLFVGQTSPTNKYRSLRYMCVDYDLNVVIDDTTIYTSTNEADDYIANFDGLFVDGKFTILFSKGNLTNINEGNSVLCRCDISVISSSITFFYSTEKDVRWKKFIPGESIEFNLPSNEIKLKTIFEAPTYNCSPEIDYLVLETWNDDKGESRQSEFHSKRITTIQNDGKGVLLADCDPGDGDISWFISFDGGASYSPVKLNQEFVYNHVNSPDFRVKSVLSVRDNAKKPPLIRSFTVKTSHVVLHSDIEQIQLNLMKTNFKIDTYTMSSKNGLYKMTIDTLSDENGIDRDKSDYQYFHGGGYVGGNYIYSVPEEVKDPVKTLLLTTDELHDQGVTNSRIEYFASVDGGITFKKIVPNVKLQVSNTNLQNCKIVMKAVFYEGARLTAWGWAWD